MNQSNVTTTVNKTPVTLRELTVSKFQKEGSKTAILEQKITTTKSYPSKKISNSMNANLFDADDFGYESQKFSNTETRVAFMLVPASASEEQVKAKLANAKNACIHRVLSSTPILDEDQKYAMSVGNRTMDDFANRQVARYPKGSKDAHGNSIEGQIILDDEGKVFYRRTFLSLESVEDSDNRGGSDYYVSPQIEAELQGASVLANQSY